MNYKLLVLDIDGTLTNSQKIITEQTKQAIVRAQEKGVKIVLASGRPTFGVWPIAEQLELEKRGGYILSFNGGCILDCKTGEKIYEKVLSAEVPAQLRCFAQGQEVALLTYEKNTIITENPTNPYVQKEASINRMHIKKVDDFCAYVDFPITKCMLVGDGDYLKTVEQAVKQQVGDSLSVYRSEPFFLEIMPQKIDKAYALGKLLEHTGLQQEQLIACGDGFNDISMIRYAGLGIAMENAQEVVKEVADALTASNDDDGVAAAIHKYLL